MAKNIKNAFHTVLMFALCLIALGTEPAHAEIIKGDTPIAGLSYYIDKYVKAGGNMADAIADRFLISAEEREVLYRIVEAEVTGEGSEEYLKAKMNVASCIITRWQQGWAKTVTDVVFQKIGGSYQFSPIGDKRYYSVTVTAQTQKAVDKVLKWGVTHDSTYFCTRTCSSYKSGFHSKLKHTFDDCVHTYFKDK